MITEMLSCHYFFFVLWKSKKKVLENFWNFAFFWTAREKHWKRKANYVIFKSAQNQTYQQ